jgi:AcrR family transcriptional regulator
MTTEVEAMTRPAHPELRGEILKAATRIVEDCGPDCVTMRQVAEEIGYSPTTLYHHFKDKEAILHEIVGQGFRELGAFLASSAVGPTAIDKLRQRSRAYILWGITNPGMYLLMFESRDPGVAWASGEPGEAGQAVAEGVATIGDAIEAGQLDAAADPMRLGMTLWAATHGVTSLAISKRLVPGMGSMPAVDVVAAATSMGDGLVNAVLAPHGS